MEASDMDTDDTSFHAPEIRRPGAWLGVVGAGIAIVLICVVWTFWT